MPERQRIRRNGLNVVKVARCMWSISDDVLSFEGKGCVERVANLNQLVNERTEFRVAGSKFVEVSDALIQIIVPYLHGRVECDLSRREKSKASALLIRIRGVRLT